MNYLQFYGLNQEPFSNAPVSKFFFNSAQHSKALLRLQYAAESMKGLALLVGDIGAGKTTLARRVLDQLPEDAYVAALLVIIHSGITAEWLLKRIATQLGVTNPADDKLTVLKQLHQRLTEIHQSGKKAVVLIDEAQMLQTREIMEEFRGLLNMEIPGQKLLTFIFFGLPEVEENLKLDEPLAQRVALRYHLEPLNEEATRNYIHHRLRLAGCQREIFDPTAIGLVHRYSRGIPRLINTICDNALFEGSLLKKNLIEAGIIQNIARDLGLSEEAAAAQRRAEQKQVGSLVKNAHATYKQQVAARGQAASHGAKERAALAQHDDEIDSVMGKFDEITLGGSAKPKTAQPQEDDEISSILDKFGK